MKLVDLTELFGKAGCKKLYAKTLSPNDNSKNQVYFAGAVEALNIFPSDEIFAENTKRGPSFKARLKFSWLLESGQLVSAPGAQLILYSQYPEVRFSGFLKGCEAPPSKLMVPRLEGRVLFLGVTDDRRVLGYVVSGDSEIAGEIRASTTQPMFGVFIPISLPAVLDESDSRTKLLTQLHRINRLGWIQSKQLDAHGRIKDCNAPQCGGFTLEAELGIAKNSDAEPDYFGWEVKQHSVTSFDNVGVGQITLLTPEPTGGFYKEEGVEAFVRKFGYLDKNDKPDRMNFGGTHKTGERHPMTGLTIALQGYDAAQARITDANGAVALLNDAGEVAASWAFTGLFEHWSRKHSKAVYVPSQCEKEPIRKYRYGNKVRLAQKTDSLRLLKAFATGAVYYDPGVKLENISTKPFAKRRNQFRIKSKSIGAIYETVEVVEV